MLKNSSYKFNLIDVHIRIFLPLNGIVKQISYLKLKKVQVISQRINSWEKEKRIRKGKRKKVRKKCIKKKKKKKKKKEKK